jgi:hypothetical protein
VTFLPLVLLVAAVITVYVVVARRAERAPVKYGPQGRWWWLKLLAGFAITMVVLYLFVWSYVTFHHRYG